MMRCSVVVVVQLLAVAALECGHFDSNMGATYDLSDLIRTSDEPSYEVTDGDIPCTKYVEQNFTYTFNICGTVAGGVPSICKTMPGLNKAAALQVDKRILSDPSDDYCYVAGVFDSTAKLEVLDQQDPTKGLRMTYYGDYCHNPPVQRTFKVELLCADKLNPIPTHALEYSHCEYTVTLPSVYGCPLECPVADRQLCGGNGHCHYDNDKSSARCFCNHGYEGKDCMTKTKEEELNYSPALLGLIITLFVVIGLLVAGILLMIRQLAAYKEDITHYQALKGDESETI